MHNLPDSSCLETRLEVIDGIEYLLRIVNCDTFACILSSNTISDSYQVSGCGNLIDFIKIKYKITYPSSEHCLLVDKYRFLLKLAHPEYFTISVKTDKKSVVIKKYEVI